MNQLNLKCILIPGNGGATMHDHWFPYAIRKIRELGIDVVARDFPDSILARESFWIPFLRDELGADENSILIGHSSGGVATMRFAESHKIYGSVLIGACYTDLGQKNEKVSGYYNRPWEWERIKANQKWIIQFASTDDPFVPITEARFIHEHLNTEYHEFTGRSHFMIPEFSELIEVVKEKL